MSTQFRTITKAQLIDALEGLDDNDLVAFSADYGDRGHTMQALPIHGNVNEEYVQRSGYSASGWAVAESTDDDGDSDDIESVESMDGDDRSITIHIIS